MKNQGIPQYGFEDDPKKLEALKAFAATSQDEHPTLSAYLNRLMKEKDMNPPEVYSRAYLDRQVYDRLVQFDRPGVKPARASRRTLMQIAIGLYATESEAIELLATCGYAFALSSTDDQAFLFCIRHGYYHMYYVYEAIEIIHRQRGDQESNDA